MTDVYIHVHDVGAPTGTYLLYSLTLASINLREVSPIPVPVGSLPRAPTCQTQVQRNKNGSSMCFV